MSSGYRAAPRFPQLGERFYDVVEPARFPEHRLRYRNARAARSIGLDTLDPGEWLDHLARFRPLPDNLEQPLALRYHGHQFQSYNPQLGDGRGFLYAQVLDVDDDRLLDLGTKGSGTTPWSRGGDGRLTLKGGVREVLATELLEALGVYTSKSLSLVETGEDLVRGDEPSPTRSSVLVRLSHSHVRFGSFQRHLHARDADAVERLVAYSRRELLGQRDDASGAEAALAFLRAVVANSAELAARWTAAGFVHGVLNTDNMNVTGESFDYGPWRMLPVLDPGHVAAYFDQTGLYAFGRQPSVLAWNLDRLADCLTLVAEADDLVEVLKSYEPAFHAALGRAFCDRLGLASRAPDADRALAQAVWSFLASCDVGFERFFFDWFGADASAARAATSPSAAAYRGAEFDALRAAWSDHEAPGAARLEHAYFQADAPCTLLIDEVEALWEPIAAHDDWSAFQARLGWIAHMREALRDA